jgi:uncharacterized membrane protein (UPF0127 family)
VQLYTVVNVSRGTRLADRAAEARSFGSRLWGWMGRTRIEPGEGLHLVPCGAVHTFFMRQAIDVLALDASHRVLRVFAQLRPWRLTPWVKGTRSVLELPPGTARSSGTAAGDQLTFSTLGV